MPEQIGRYKIRFSEDEVLAFKKSWPCSGLQDRSYWFEFEGSKYGFTLVDTDLPEQDDGVAALALSHEAQRYLEELTSPD